MPFIWVDGLPETEQHLRRQELQRGSALIERVTTVDGGKDISIPDGLVHHWMGLLFVPGATLDSGLALLQDYDRHAEIYRPAVARSRLLARDGDMFRVYLRFFMKKGITVVVNSENDAYFTRDGVTAHGVVSTAHASQKSRLQIRPASARSPWDATVAICGGSKCIGVFSSAMGVCMCSASRSPSRAAFPLASAG